MRIKQYNKILEQEKAGYRIVSGEIAPVTNEAEINTIEQSADTPFLMLECYDEVNISAYRQKIYEYIYTRYKGAA